MNQERTQEKLTEWKSRAEHLNVQLHLGAQESRDAFEKQKIKLKSWADEASHKLKEYEKENPEKALALKSSLEELRLQIALGKAETKDALDEQQKIISLGIQDFQKKVETHTDATDLKIKEFAEFSSDQLDDFKTSFDLFKLHLHFGKSDLKNEWEEKKLDIADKLDELKTKLEQKSEESSADWDDFSSEMSAAWEHVQSAFKKS